MESKNRQPLKIMSNLKRISELDLKEKAKFMEGSIFHGLSKVYNKREQSATLIASFCKTYDATKKVFVLNNEISFGFCSSEVAMVLNLEDTGIFFKDYDTHCSKYPKKFPDFLFKLRELYAEETDKNVGFTSKHLKDILKNMVVDDEESKLQFRRLMSYYLIEQVLLCTSSKKPRASWWKLVCDIDMFEKVNWSKATFDHLLESVNETKEWLERGVGSQHEFKGAAPVLEAIVYERIPSVQPKIFSVDPPLIQKYKSQRNDATSWAKIKLLMATDISICPHCATMANEDDGFSSHDDELVVLPCSLATEASSSQVAKEKKPTERADIVREDEEKATNLADNGRAGSFIDANGIYMMPQSLSLSLSRNSFLKDSFTHEMSGLGMPRESGPWGPAGGMPWDDGVFSNVKQVHVYMGECSKVICGIQFAYVKRDGKSILSQLHGGTRGDKTELVELDGGEEYLTGILGFYGSVEEFNGLEGITSITFHTNKKMYGPYGQRSGVGYVYFASTSFPGKVVGFQGRSGDFLTAIGVHMEYF